MTDTPEGRFTAAINRRLPETIHHESCTTPFRSGTPDQYYEGDEGTCRIEFKFIKTQKLPAFIELGNIKKKYALSTNQNEWLTRAFYNNVSVAVVLGTKLEVIFFTSPVQWNSCWTRHSSSIIYTAAIGFPATPIVARDTIAQWIIERVT